MHGKSGPIRSVRDWPQSDCLSQEGASGEGRGDAGGGDTKLSTGSMDIEKDPSHQEADQAAHAHHRPLFRFKHHTRTSRWFEGYQEY